MTKLNVQTKKNEKGVALIFTLIMLSLLMIMALAFALDSMFEQKSAYNSANASAARILAKSQLKQVLTLIQSYDVNLKVNIYSKDLSYSTASPIKDFDMLKEQNPLDPVIPYSRLRVVNVLDENNDNSCLTGTDPPVNWNYIRNSDDHIIGRTAFVVIPDAKIPLDSLVDDRAVSATFSATCLYPKHDEKDDTETRIGKYVSEINVRAAIPAVTTNIDTITEKLNWNGTTAEPPIVLGFVNGKYTGTNWTSFLTLFGVITDIIDDEKSNFSSNLSLAVSDDKEAFWADNNGNDKIDDGELYKRFDLTRYWTTADNAADLVFLRDKILLDTVPIPTGAPTTPMEAWADIASDATSKGLPWLACFGYQADGTVASGLEGEFSNVVDRRNQIAANLKDYCDTDNRPTSNLAPTSWKSLSAGVHPTFTGNERTPYINKIGFKIKASQGQLGTDPDTVWANVEAKPCVELINIYGQDWPDQLNVNIQGFVKIETTVNSTMTPLSQPFNSTIEVLSSDWSTTGYSNLIVADTSVMPTEINKQTSVPILNRNIDVKIKEIIITRVILLDDADTDAYDYVKELSDNTDIAIFSGSSGEQTAWYGFAVHDPRQNLHAADWVKMTPLIDDAPETVFSLLAGGPPYAGASNADGPTPTDRPDVGGIDADKEAGSDPANKALSTAYIRNAPMESPWELGFIHRGVKWQTINLKNYVPGKGISVCTIGANQYIAGGGAYADGDANILDQIKMTDAAKSPQKINLRATEDIFFDALFSKIRLGCDITRDTSVPFDPALHMLPASIAGLNPSSGTEIDIDTPSAAYLTMRGAIKTWFETDTNLSRASVVGDGTNILISANASDTISLGGAVTDAAQEELIGKMINLTKFGSGTGNFTIIVVAQTIKDVGGDATDISIWKTPADGTDALEVDCQLGSFDVKNGVADNNNDTWTDDAYGDDITSEQKILVTGSYISGTLKIKSFRYID